MKNEANTKVEEATGKMVDDKRSVIKGKMPKDVGKVRKNKRDIKDELELANNDNDL